MSAVERALPRFGGAGTELKDVDIRLLLEGIRLCDGYDFREYAGAPLRRGLQMAMSREDALTVSAHQDKVLHDAGVMQRFLGTVGVNVTTMFRDRNRCKRSAAVTLPWAGGNRSSHAPTATTTSRCATA